MKTRTTTHKFLGEDPPCVPHAHRLRALGFVLTYPCINSCKQDGAACAVSCAADLHGATMAISKSRCTTRAASPQCGGGAGALRRRIACRWLQLHLELSMSAPHMQRAALRAARLASETRRDTPRRRTCLGAALGAVAPQCKLSAPAALHCCYAELGAKCAASSAASAGGAPVAAYRPRSALLRRRGSLWRRRGGGRAAPPMCAAPASAQLALCGTVPGTRPAARRAQAARQWPPTGRAARLLRFRAT